MPPKTLDSGNFVFELSFDDFCSSADCGFPSLKADDDDEVDMTASVAVNTNNDDDRTGLMMLLKGVCV